MKSRLMAVVAFVAAAAIGVAGWCCTLAAMNNLSGEGGYDDGRETVTHVSELLFAGRF